MQRLLGGEVVPAERERGLGVGTMRRGDVRIGGGRPPGHLERGGRRGAVGVARGHGQRGARAGQVDPVVRLEGRARRRFREVRRGGRELLLLLPTEPAIVPIVGTAPVQRDRRRRARDDLVGTARRIRGGRVPDLAVRPVRVEAGQGDEQRAGEGERLGGGR